jgi:hypothetical protein
MRLTPIVSVLTLLPATLVAQRGWKDIGTTAAGNHVYVDPRTVKTNGNLVSATLRVVFNEPVRARNGTYASSRTVATFDCAKKSLAAKENVFYSDAKGTKPVERTAAKQPGFGPALGGSLGGVALQYLCSR